MHPTVEHVVYILENSAQKDWWEPLVAIAAVVIASCALIFTLYQAWAERRSRILQQTPNITFFTINKQSINGYPAEFVFGVINTGVGPAYIEKVQTFLDDIPILKLNQKSLRLAARSIFDEYQPDAQRPDLSTSILLNGHYLPVNSNDKLFEIVRYSGWFDPIEISRGYEKRFKLEITYYNILDPSKKLKFIYPNEDSDFTAPF